MISVVCAPSSPPFPASDALGTGPEKIPADDVLLYRDPAI